MNSIPVAAQPFVLIAAITTSVCIAALIRLYLLRRVEEKLLKNKDALEKQVVLQQKELMTVRQDTNTWRTEMARQFDLFRHMASDQLKVEEKRFDDLITKTRQREFELQTSLDIARQMCAELPAAKARVLQLEATMGRDGGEDFSGNGGGDGGPETPLSPLPDLGSGGVSLKTNGAHVSESPTLSMPALPVVEESKVQDLEQKLAAAEKQNTLLQQALTAARLRSRLRGRSQEKSKSSRN